MREDQQKRKVPTGYDRLCVGKTEAERAAAAGLLAERRSCACSCPTTRRCTFVDLVRGEVSAPRPDDQVLLKADGFPTYHLAVVVDDHLMGITHVVRGEEWISSTPKHLLLFDWLGWERPAFAHMPLLRNADKSKISKRKNPAARLTWFVEQGYLPEALLNFLGLLGYSLPDGRGGLLVRGDVARRFDWARVNTVGPVFDLDKLGWLNGHYVRELSEDELRRAGAAVPAARGARRATRRRPSSWRSLAGAGAAGADPRGAAVGAAGRCVRFLFVAEDDFAVDPAAAAKALVADAARRCCSPRPTRSRPWTDWTTEAVQAAVDARAARGRARAQARQGLPAAARRRLRRVDRAAAARVDGAARARSARCAACGPRPRRCGGRTADVR